MISLYLGPTIWNSSAPSNNAAFSLPFPLTPCFEVVGGTPMFSSFSSSPLQPSFSQLSLLLLSLPLSLPSKLHVQPNVTSVLLLLVFLLYLLLLLFKHIGIILRNVGGGRGRHNNTETRAKNFLFHLYIIDLGTITGFLDKLNRTSKAQS